MRQQIQSKWKFTLLRMARVKPYLIEHWPLFKLKGSFIFFLHVRRHIRSGNIRHDKKVKMWSLSKNIMPDVSHYTRYGYINHFFNFLAFMYTIFFALTIIDMILWQKLIEVRLKSILYNIFLAKVAPL